MQPPPKGELWYWSKTLQALLDKRGPLAVLFFVLHVLV